MELTCACSRLALAIFRRPEHTSLLPPSTAHRLFWAPAKDTAPETNTHTHSLTTDSAKCYKPIISCPHAFLLSRSHRPPPTLTLLSTLLFSTPSFLIAFLFPSSSFALSWPYICRDADVQLVSGTNLISFLSSPALSYSSHPHFFLQLLISLSDLRRRGCWRSVRSWPSLWVRWPRRWSAATHPVPAANRRAAFGSCW